MSGEFLAKLEPKVANLLSIEPIFIWPERRSMTGPAMAALAALNPDLFEAEFEALQALRRRAFVTTDDDPPGDRT